MKQLSLTICFLLIFTMYSQAQNASRIIRTDWYIGLAMAENCESFSLGPKLKRFMPDEIEIAKMEAELFQNIDTILQKQGEAYNTEGIADHLAVYRRQYFGFYNKKGEKIIYVNLAKVNDLWGYECQELIVLDGGNSFWQICYHVKAKRFFSLSVNGDA